MSIPCVKVVFVAYRMSTTSGQRRGCRSYRWYRIPTLPPIRLCNHKVKESSIVPNIFDSCDIHTPLCLCHCHDRHPFSIKISWWKPCPRKHRAIEMVSTEKFGLKIFCWLHKTHYYQRQKRTNGEDRILVYVSCSCLYVEEAPTASQNSGKLLSVLDSTCFLQACFEFCDFRKITFFILATSKSYFHNTTTNKTNNDATLNMK